MRPLAAADFDAFFQGVHGHPPFPWQRRLVARLAAGAGWPESIDVPTGCGKTAVLDAAVFHLALEANRGADRSAPMRTALVVDRQLVVDDAFARARRIETALREAAAACRDDAVGIVAARLAALSGNEPLVARRLRGGVPREDDWARTPVQPTLLCSTVDQVGSRLLFRGYGVSDGMKPVHAGLLGDDAAILLDEAHLSNPFIQTLEAIRKLGSARFAWASLSATPAAGQLGLAPDDRANPVLARRVGAAKPARLRKTSADALADALTEEAARLMGEAQATGRRTPAVGVVVNRIALARAVHKRLVERDDAAALLMIGRARSTDRAVLAEALQPYKTADPGRVEAPPLFVVSTQCIEAGVDLDLDALATQAAPLDALRQRFGRVNRDGTATELTSAVVAAAEDVKRRAEDPVYGDRSARTWEAIADLAEDGVLDFGVDALAERLAESDLDVIALSAPRPNAPAVMPAYLRLWSQTSPIPANDPEVGLFLHGAAVAPASISVAWRADIEPGCDASAIVEAMPPRAAETIELPLGAVRAWLRGAAPDLSDALEAVDEQDGRRGRVAFRWRGAGDPANGLAGADSLRPGDVLVAPAAFGGCDAFGWAPGSIDPVPDAADAAAWSMRGMRLAVRVHPLLGSGPPGRLRETLAAHRDDSAAKLLDAVIDALPPEVEESDEAEPAELPPLRGRLLALRHGTRRIEARFPYPEVDGAPGGVVFVAPFGLRGAGPGGSVAATEDDAASTRAACAVALDAHAEAVAAEARRFAAKLGFSPDLVDDIALAGFLHDVGKADRRFQLMLQGGDVWNFDAARVLAKSASPAAPSARERAGLPAGWRHEADSVRLARQHARFAEANDPDLVLWLIGAHHGRGRPFFPAGDALPPKARTTLPVLGVEAWEATEAPGPESLAFDVDGRDWTALFESLSGRHGTWRLAFLEAVLRLADHRVSEEAPT